MKVTTYLDGLTRREGLKFSTNRAQIGEVYKLMDGDSDGVLSVLVKAGVFEGPFELDPTAVEKAIKALAKEL